MGPRSIVDTIEYVTTDTLRLDNVSDDVDQEVPLSTVEDNLDIGAAVRAFGQMCRFWRTMIVAGVPVKIRNAGGRRLRADPEFVMVESERWSRCGVNLNPKKI